MKPDKLDVLKSLSFGQRVAEEEIADLARYFVQTDQWRQLYAGTADVVYGLKGSGKSALYFSLLDHKDDLRERGVVLVAGENPRGAPAFRDLVEDPPTSEQEFRYLWKLYLLQLLGQTFVQLALSSDDARSLVDALEQSSLLPRSGGLKALLRAALDYVRHFTKPEGIEGIVKIDPNTGAPIGFGGKVVFREPSTAARKAGAVSVDSLFQNAQNVLEDCGLTIWILLDRLDVAFADSFDLEKNALRALFIAYSDLRAFDRITPKIFLRTDIWARITAEGFREASHITRAITINWDENALLNLMVRRIVQSALIESFYEVSAASVLKTFAAQEELFYRMFPAQVDVGSRRPNTFKWILTRTQDGSMHTAPRELIHLLSETRNAQLRQFEIGEGLPTGEQLFAGQTLKTALQVVSRVRLEQTLFAEYPNLREYIQRLRGAKTQQSLESLEEIWAEPPTRVAENAKALVDVGFFEARGTRDDPAFWVPFLYRDALEMSQGAAE